METKIEPQYNRILVRLRPQKFLTMKGCDFYIKRNLFWDKWTLYRDTPDGLVPFWWQLGEPFIDDILFFFGQQRQEFFKVG